MALIRCRFLFLGFPTIIFDAQDHGNNSLGVFTMPKASPILKTDISAADFKDGVNDKKEGELKLSEGTPYSTSTFEMLIFTDSRGIPASRRQQRHLGILYRRDHKIRKYEQ